MLLTRAPAEDGFDRSSTFINAHSGGGTAKPKRAMSAKARKAIVDAQRKRWAAKKTADAAGAETSKKDNPEPDRVAPRRGE
jgi:hypothetical protein